MSLVKGPSMTESKWAANQHNAKLSQGHTTEEGKARIGAAQFRHGLYAKSRASAVESCSSARRTVVRPSARPCCENLWPDHRPLNSLRKTLPATPKLY